jgi:hypothetical protein
MRLLLLVPGFWATTEDSIDASYRPHRANRHGGRPGGLVVSAEGS